LTNLKEVRAGVTLNLAGIGLATAFAYLVIAPARRGPPAIIRRRV
jgi:hypothetical protein